VFYFSTFGKLTSDAVYCLISQIQSGDTTPALEVLYDGATNILIPLPRNINVRIKCSEEPCKRRLIEIPLADLISSS